MTELEPQIFNKPLFKTVDETTMKIHLDVMQLRKKLPMPYTELREILKNIVKHHVGYVDGVVELRQTAVLVGDFAIEKIYKFYTSGVEITMYGVEKVWNGFDWVVKSFSGLKVEKVVLVR